MFSLLRYCFAYMVGTSTGSEVVINTEEKTVEVNAYSMEDANEVLRQVRFSGVSELHPIDSLTINTRERFAGVSAELGLWSAICKR